MLNAISNPKILNKPDIGLLFLRLAVGGLMLFHGVAKMLHGIDGIIKMSVAKGLPELFAYGIYIGEVVAPILIIIGFLTRPAAFIMVYTMIMSIYMAFGWAGFALNQHGGVSVELNLLYLFGALALVFTGAGKYGLDKE